jgi:deoxyribodipyrimidine photo-lyase
VYSPEGIRLGAELKAGLLTDGVACKSFNAQLLTEPTEILNKQGTPFKVFTPFWRHVLSNLEPKPVHQEPELLPTSHLIASEPLESWGLLPDRPNWASAFDERWNPGEKNAQLRFQYFKENIIFHYKDGRDLPSTENTSMLSPHLAFGEISPKQIWFELQEGMACGDIDSENGNKFLSELGWREYSRYLLVHFPEILSEPFNAKFEAFPWENNKKLLSAWQRGQTGYPIVDAGMRELWATGYMHNRVRMVVASFLCKHCLIHWKEGADWFWNTLLDADLANNTASWQWVAGCGADASPYFRVFNPILQGEKFDKNGVYVKKWVPELAQLGVKFIHKPWQADSTTLTNAGVRLGDNYPLPVVEHKLAREQALSAYSFMKTAQLENM